MKQKEIEWIKSDYGSEIGKIGSIIEFEFEVFKNIDGFCSRLELPNRMAYKNGKWVYSSLNQRCDGFKTIDEAKQKCKDYISDILSELMEG